MTAARTLTVLEVDSFNPNSIDDDLKNTLKTVSHSKDSHIIIRSLRPTLPNSPLLHIYVSARSGQHEPKWVPFECPELPSVPKGIYHWDGIYVYNTTSNTQPLTVERRKSDDGSPTRMATIQEEPFKQEEEIPNIFAACDYCVERHSGNQKYIFKDYNPIYHLHPSRHERKHSQTSGVSHVSGISQGSSSQASDTSRKTSPPRRQSWSFFPTSNVTKSTRTRASQTGAGELETLFNGSEETLVQEFGEGLIISIESLYEEIYTHTYYLTVKDERGEKKVEIRETVEKLIKRLQSYAIQYCGDQYGTRTLVPDEHNKAVVELLKHVKELEIQAQLSGLQVIIKYASRIAGAIIGALGATYIPVPAAVASLGSVTFTVGSVAISLSTCGLFAAGAVGAFCGYQLGKAVGNNVWATIPVRDRVKSLVAPVKKDIYDHFPEVVQQMRLK